MGTVILAAFCCVIMSTGHYLRVCATHNTSSDNNSGGVPVSVEPSSPPRSSVLVGDGPEDSGRALPDRHLELAVLEASPQESQQVEDAEVSGQVNDPAVTAVPIAVIEAENGGSMA